MKILVGFCTVFLLFLLVEVEGDASARFGPFFSPGYDVHHLNKRNSYSGYGGYGHHGYGHHGYGHHGYGHHYGGHRAYGYGHSYGFLNGLSHGYGGSYNHHAHYGHGSHHQGGYFGYFG